MTKPSKKPDDTDEKQFKQVVQHFLNTPHKPHKSTSGKKKGGDDRRKSKGKS